MTPTNIEAVVAMAAPTSPRDGMRTLFNAALTPKVIVAMISDTAGRPLAEIIVVTTYNTPNSSMP